MRKILRSQICPRGYGYYDHRERTYAAKPFSGKWLLITVAAVVCFIIMVANFQAAINSANDTAAKRLGLVREFNFPPEPPESNPGYRQALALNMLSLDAIDDRITDYQINQEDGEALRSQLSTIYLTGEELHLSGVAPPTWSNFWGKQFLLYLTMVTTVLSTILSYTYHRSCVRRGEYLADLPWRESWVWSFVILTPPLWVFYLFSACVMALDGPNTAKDTTVVKRKRWQSSEEAWKLYRTLRMDGETHANAESRWRDAQKTALANLQAAIDSVDESLAGLAASGRRLNRKKNDLQVQRRNTEQLQFATLPATPEELRTEFEKLVSLPDVKRVAVHNDQLVVWLHARIRHKGKTYDLGDWQLAYAQGGKLKTTRLRSGLRSTWSAGKYPDYHLSDGSFCLGSNSDQISMLLSQGRILEAFSLAVTVMRSVNEKDIALIPQAFKETR